MSGAEQLVKQISKLLEKHEVHNEVLAIELSIIILQRERTELNRALHNNINLLREV